MLRSDPDLKTQIHAELASDVGCQAAAIDVTVRNGVVTLSGSIHDPRVARAAVCAVKRVYGVEGIAERFTTGADHAVVSSIP